MGINSKSYGFLKLNEGTTREILSSNSNESIDPLINYTQMTH